MFKATINAEMFYRAHKAVSTETTRFYLQGVHLERHPSGEGVLMVATDGHILVCFYDREGTIEGDAIVKAPAHILKVCAKPLKNGKPRMLMVDDGAMEIYEGSDTLTAKGCKIDGSFPDWRRVVPKPAETDGQAGVFDQVILTKLGAILSTGKMQALSIRGKSAQDPHLVVGSHPWGFGVAMSVRENAHAPKNPSFDW